MLDQRRVGRHGSAATRSSGTKAAGSTFHLWRSVPLLAALVAVGGSLKANGVAAFSTPQPVVTRVLSTDLRGDTCLAAAFDRSEDAVEEEKIVSSRAEYAGTEGSNNMLSSVVNDIASKFRSVTVASALFVSVLLGDGGVHTDLAVNQQAAWAADAPAAKPAATTTTTTSSPVEASLHIPKLRHQIKSLQKTLLDKEAVLREDQRSVTKNLETTKRLKIELQRAQDEEKKVKLELEKNDKKKQAAKSTAAPAPAAAAKSTSTSTSNSNKPKSKPASLSKTQVKSLQSRLDVATKRITNTKSALSTAEADLKTSQTALDKSTKEVAKVKKELKDARQKLKDAKRVRGAEGRYVFDSLAPLTFGGGLVWWLLNNQNYGRDGYYGEDGYDRDGYYDEYGYDGGRGGRGGRMSRRKSQRKQFQTALVILSAIGLTSSISSFNSEGDGLTSTVVPIILGVGILSWVVVWQQRQRDEYYGIDRRRERYDEYGNRIVGSEDLIDTTATQAAIILFSALGLTAALLSYGSYGNDVSDLLNGSTFLVIAAVGVGLWAYNNNEYVDQYNEYGERVYGSGRRFDRGVPFDFDAVFSRMYDGDDEGRANWWEWWKNDPDRFSNGLNRRRHQRSDRPYYEDDRVDVIRNDDYYANYELDRRLSGPPRATNGYFGRDVEPQSGGRSGPLARRGEYARRDVDEDRYYNDGPSRGNNPPNYSRQRRDEYFDDGRYYDDNRYDGRGQAQDRRFREYSDQPPARRSPPPGAASRPSAGGEGSQNRDSNRWGNSLSQWD